MATSPTTRAAAQQQKLEEHLAVILQRLDIQKAKLDQRIAAATDRGCWTEGRASAQNNKLPGAESLQRYEELNRMQQV
jgi:hypothetical protein